MPFPTTSVIDNFNRANEGPPPSANWSGPIRPGQPRLKVVTNQVVANADDNAEDYWSNATFGPDSEAYITIPTFSNDHSSVYLRLQAPGTAGVDGYRELSSAFSSVTQIYRVDDTVHTQLGADISQAWSNGDAHGADIVVSTITAYRKPSGGSWGSLGTRTDNTYAGAGNIGLNMNSINQTGDDFGGGTIASAVFTKIVGGRGPGMALAGSGGLVA